jgi:hypothetical protein
MMWYASLLLRGAQLLVPGVLKSFRLMEDRCLKDCGRLSLPHRLCLFPSVDVVSHQFDQCVPSCFLAQDLHSIKVNLLVSV